VKLIAGLGNPGDRYRDTRHNVGFEVLDRIAARLGSEFSREKHRGQYAEVRIAGQKVILLKPMTFMNLSGDSVARAARNGVNHPSEVLIVYDDVDLPLGKIRLRTGGSAGGHNGMKSVIERLGTQDVPRLRIGVGSETTGGERVDHVLGRFRPEEREIVDEAIERAADACVCCVEEGLETAMNKFN